MVVVPERQLLIRANVEEALSCYHGPPAGGLSAAAETESQSSQSHVDDADAACVMTPTENPHCVTEN